MKKYLLLLLIIIVGCSTGNDRDLPKHIRDLENVSVFSIPANPDTLLLSREHIYGDTDSLLLSDISDIAVDNSGTVYIGDGDQNTIHAFDNAGNQITQIGGEGDGPGEFRRLREIKTTDNQLYTYDPSNFRLNFYSLESKKYVDQTIIDPKNFQNIEGLAGATSLSEFYLLSNGRLLAGLNKMNTTEDILINYYLVNKEGNVVSDKLLQQQDINLYVIDDIKTVLTLPFARKPLISVSHKEDIYSAHTEDFLIKKYDSTGKYKAAFYYPYKKASLVKSEFLERYPAGPFRNGISKAEYPEAWPALDEMLIDDKDRLWISTITANEEVYQWWVLKNTGEMEARFSWPRSKEIKEIKDNKLYTIEGNEETGIESVVRYSIKFSK